MTTSNFERPRFRRRNDESRRSGRRPESPRRDGKAAPRSDRPARFDGPAAAKREALRLDRFRTQALTVLESLRALIRGVFGEDRPADRELAGLVRTRRGCGSRDRAAVSAVFYAVARYYGALRALLPDSVASRIERGDGDFADAELAALAVTALVFEGEHGELASSLGKLFALPEVPMPPADASFEKRAAAAAAFTGAEHAPAPETLLPAELAEFIPQDLSRLTRLMARRPPLWIRLQHGGEAETLAELAASGMTVRRHPRVAAAVALTGGKLNVFTLESFRAGRFEVQDLASQCVGLVCAPKPGERWFDACAGGGGKTLELAVLMRRRGTVIAGDVREGILHELKLRARRAGFPNISTLHHDGRVPRGFHPCDGVLVDAPCSGSGVWRRNPGSAWKFRPAELKEYARRQYDILAHFSTAVKPGGVLVYATCSLFREENEEVVGRFLAAHPDFALESGTHPLTGTIVNGLYHFDGFDDDCDFLFAARMRRKFGRDE